MKVDYIQQGDCVELMRQLPDECIDLTVTSPPPLWQAAKIQRIRVEFYRSGERIV